MIKFPRQAKYARRKGEEFQVFLREFKLTRGCIDCGVNGDWRILEFDHVPGRGKKVHNLSRMHTHTPLQKMRELAKCDVVCANCHAIRTHERGEYASRSIRFE